MIFRFRAPDSSAATAERLYEALVARARTPIFHTGFAVPDTMDGRFDLLTLHAFLVMDALKHEETAGADLGPRLATLIFAGFEDALRELGVGDIGLSRRIKAMADAFYGRLAAYGAARSEADLVAAIERNLYRGNAAHAREAARLAHYMESSRAALRAEPQALLQGRAIFGPLPST